MLEFLDAWEGALLWSKIVVIAVLLTPAWIPALLWVLERYSERWFVNE